MVRRNFRFLAAACAVLVAVAVPSAVAANDPSGVAGAEGNDLWFVETTSPDAFRAKAKGAGIEFTQRFEYTKLWKGVSIKLANASHASLLTKIDGVEAIYPVLEVTTGPTEAVSEPEIMHAVAMTGADVAQNELGLTGQGVDVAVIDTGVDYNNPALGGCASIGAGCRVAKGWDFVGDRFNAAGSGGALVPHPDGDPDDCQGHGSHVAGIVGANGNVNGVALKGVAPGVTFGAYRVFGCEGSTTTDVMAAAMERALADGMDVVNMSIGSAFMTWPQYPSAVAADALVDNGVVVVASIGNSGANGVYSAGAPGVGKKVIGVASFDNSHVELKTFTAAPDNAAFGYMQASAAPDAPTSGTMPLTRTGTTTTANDACAALPAGSLTGKVALIRRGTCTFHIKSLNAQNAGAIGVVLYNNSAGLFSPTVAGTPAITIPVVAVSDVSGAALSARIPTALTSTVDITWTDQTGVFANPTAGLASSFTSYGLTAELDLKPDIGAPGGLIKSAYPLENGGVATLSGTSMASPHVAGAVALFLERHPGASPANVRTILQNSADPIPNAAGASTREPVHRQGAGMVDIDDAILADTVVTPGKIALGEGTGGTATLTITNNSAAARTYSLGHQPGRVTAGSTFAPGSGNFPATVTFSQSSVDVPAGQSGTVNVTITIPLFQGVVYGGWLTVTSGGKTYRVPYAGFDGDYQAIRVLAPGGCNFPGVFKRGGETTCVAATATAPAVTLPGWTLQSAGATFNVEEATDRPVLLYHRAHQSRRLEIRAVNQATGTSYLVAAGDYLSRNQTNDRERTGYTVYTWDGKYVADTGGGRLNRREAPLGQYKLQLVVTKALAEAGNAAHVETWDSPAFTIVRVGA